jgi:hypothetical protein
VSDLVPDPDALTASQSQPEFETPIWENVDAAETETRIRNGQASLRNGYLFWMQLRRSRRKLRANMEPNVRIRHRTVLCEIAIPRSANSSTSQSVSVNEIEPDRVSDDLG